MSDETRFQPVLPCSTTSSDPSSVKRVILCSGKHFYTLDSERSSLGLQSQVALIRIEELSPFPFQALLKVLEPYLKQGGSHIEMIYCQEEPRNQGAWPHVMPRMDSILKKLGWKDGIRYVGRKESGVVATGVVDWHKREVEELRKAAFEGL